MNVKKIVSHIYVFVFALVYTYLGALLVVRPLYLQCFGR